MIISFGGENNKFNLVGVTDFLQLAKNIINFAKSVGANGLDFDLEDISIVEGQDG